MRKDGFMNEEKSDKAKRMADAYDFFLKKKFVYLADKTEEAWDAYTNAYYAWIDAVCDEIGAEHNQRVCAREAGKGD